MKPTNTQSITKLQTDFGVIPVPKGLLCNKSSIEAQSIMILHEMQNMLTATWSEPQPWQSKVKIPTLRIPKKWVEGEKPRAKAESCLALLYFGGMVPLLEYHGIHEIVSAENPTPQCTQKTPYDFAHEAIFDMARRVGQIRGLNAIKKMDWHPEMLVTLWPSLVGERFKHLMR